MPHTEMARLLDEVLDSRGRFAWYESLGDLSFLTHVTKPLARKWVDLRALDRARNLCEVLDGCLLPLNDTSGTRYYANSLDPPPSTYGDLARLLRDVIERLAVAREARRPPAIPSKPRKRRAPRS